MLQAFFLHVLFCRLYDTYTSMDIHIYIVNLHRSNHRRDFMAQQLAPLGMPYTFVDAIDGKHTLLSDFPTYNSALRIKKYGRDLKNTEVATTLSHLKALQQAQQDMHKYKNTWAVILEDDITLLPPFLSALQTLQTYPQTVHCVRLYERIKDTHNHLDCMDTHPTFTLRRSTYTNWGGALAYAVRPHAIDIYIQKNQTILHIADKMLFAIPHHGLRIYRQTPRSVRITDDIDSDIGYHRPHIYKGIGNNITRLTFRMREGCQRWWYILTHINEYLSRY